jgi:hypothetical protein
VVLEDSDSQPVQIQEVKTAPKTDSDLSLLDPALLGCSLPSVSLEGNILKSGGADLPIAVGGSEQINLDGSQS